MATLYEGVYFSILCSLVRDFFLDFIIYSVLFICFSFFSTGIADIGVVEELLVMKLIERRQRNYQSKIDDRTKMKNRLKSREGNNLKIRNKKEKKAISDQTTERNHEIIAKEETVELPSLLVDRVQLSSDNDNDNVATSTTSAAYDRNEGVNRNQQTQITSVNGNILPLLRAISVATRNSNTGNTSNVSQVTETRNNSTFGSSSLGSPPAPPLADSPNVNTDSSESEVEDESQEQQKILNSTLSNISNLQVQPSVQPTRARSPPRATTSLSLTPKVTPEYAGKKSQTFMKYQQQGGGEEEEEEEVVDEEEEEEDEEEDEEEEETEEEENEREEIEEGDRFDESQALYMEALLGKKINVCNSDNIKGM